jgi:YVTN family beta-propeller protein
MAASLLLIGNKSDDTLSFIDPETLQVLGTVPTGRGPHEVAAARDGRVAYVANYEGPGDSLSVIDVAERRELRRISLDPYRGPHGMAVTRDGRSLYVTCERSQVVVEIDLATWEVVAEIHPGKTPDGMAWV